MKIVKLAKDWELKREHTIKAGSLVLVPVHIAEQLKANGFVAVKNQPNKEEK
jgi:hypothetical protein